MSKFFTAAVVAAAALFSASTAQAQWVWQTTGLNANKWQHSGNLSLVDYVSFLDADAQNLTLQVGDKTFSDFGGLTVEGDNAAAVQAGIEIRGYYDNLANPGILFSNALWVVSDATSPTLNTNFNFTVTAGPGWDIIGARMIIVDGVINQGSVPPPDPADDLINITENVENAITNANLANLIVQAPTILGLGSPIDIGPFSAVDSVRITKDIILNRGELDGGTVALNSFAQTFQQVPEPGSLALAGLGAALVVARRRRRAADLAV